MPSYKTPNGNILEESVLREQYGERFDKFVAEGLLILVEDDENRTFSPVRIAHNAFKMAMFIFKPIRVVFPASPYNTSMHFSISSCIKFSMLVFPKPKSLRFLNVNRRCSCHSCPLANIIPLNSPRSQK